MPKRLFDLFLAALGLLLLAPVLLAVALWVVWDSPGPAFFRQQRVGRAGRLFRIVKFRTMHPRAEAAGPAITVGADARITRAGHWLRRTKIDELPQLFNVLLGHMSLVGPRPEVPHYVALYPDSVRDLVLSVRPGITGWAQVNGRNAISWADKFALDVWYVDHRSLWLDVRILWLTVRKVLVRDGISAAGEATMPRFEGDKA